MKWPGLGDPTKRKSTIRYLIITASVGLGVAFLMSSVIFPLVKQGDPLYQCINNIDAKYKITATLELYVDNQKINIPANIGNSDQCKHALYTLTNDGMIHAEWKEEHPFEIGQFLWVWTSQKDGFPKRDMDDSKSKIYVNDIVSNQYLHTPLVDGSHYKAMFYTKGYEKIGRAHV